VKGEGVDRYCEENGDVGERGKEKKGKTSLSVSLSLSLSSFHSPSDRERVFL
jgi:hypothetical protein